MISAGDFRNGVTIELEGNIYQIEFHVKPYHATAPELRRYYGLGDRHRGKHRKITLTMRKSITTVLRPAYFLWRKGYENSHDFRLHLHEAQEGHSR